MRVLARDARGGKSSREWGREEEEEEEGEEGEGEEEGGWVREEEGPLSGFSSVRCFIESWKLHKEQTQVYALLRTHVQ